MELTQKQRETLRQNNVESNAVTREAIRDALFLLLETAEYEEIRITDIIRKSGVSRSAFYRNYKTKDDVLRDAVGDMNQFTLSRFSSNVEENWRHYIRSIRQNRRKLELLIKAHREWFLLDALNERLDYSSGTDFTTALPHGYIFNMIIYWVKCGMPGTDEEVLSLILDACRENAAIMLSGVIPPEDLEKTLALRKT